MNRFFRTIGITLLAAVALSACSKVPAGNVGVKVYLLGGEKGVESEELGVGRYWIGFNEDLFLFPTFTQTDTWAGEQQIQFQTVEGMKVSADISISYSIDPKKVSLVFQKYRRGIEEISDVYLRNMVKDAFGQAASRRPVEATYGEGKSALVAEVEQLVRAQVSEIGINIERIYLASDVRLPDSVTAAINAKIDATQKAQQRENEVQTAKAAAQIAIEAARGEADAKTLVATAEANAIRMRGDALKQNAELVELTLAERWDGKLPTFQGGGGTGTLVDLRQFNRKD